MRAVHSVTRPDQRRVRRSLLRPRGPRPANRAGPAITSACWWPSARTVRILRLSRPALMQRRGGIAQTNRGPAGTGRMGMQTGARDRWAPGPRPYHDAFCSPAAVSRYPGTMVAGSARSRSSRAAPAISGVSSSPSCFRYSSSVWPPRAGGHHRVAGATHCSRGASPRSRRGLRRGRAGDAPHNHRHGRGLTLPRRGRARHQAAQPQGSASAWVWPRPHRRPQGPSTPARSSCRGVSFPGRSLIAALARVGVRLGPVLVVCGAGDRAGYASRAGDLQPARSGRIGQRLWFAPGWGSIAG